jgi:hypothetical protein
VAAGLAGLDARIVAVAPIPTANRVTAAFFIETASEQGRAPTYCGRNRRRRSFGGLGWSITSLHAVQSPD